MPAYLFQHPDTGEIVEVFQGMNQKHEYLKDGVRYNRVYTVPNASVDARIDPFSQSEFSDKTGRKKGTVGDLINYSKEMAHKRFEKEGRDSIGEKYEKEYSRKRKGKKLPGQLKNIKIDI